MKVLVLLFTLVLAPAVVTAQTTLPAYGPAESTNASLLHSRSVYQFKKGYLETGAARGETVEQMDQALFFRLGGRKAPRGIRQKFGITSDPKHLDFWARWVISRKKQKKETEENKRTGLNNLTGEGDSP